MKVITIKQPFASLISAGIKEYEFRTWETKYRGEILIHAGKSVDKEAMNRFASYNLDYPQGCIMAKANLTECIKVDDNMKKLLKRKNAHLYANTINNNEKEHYAFKLENIDKINPIYVKGQLGFWNYEYKKDKNN